jgi:hypothetical protein
VIAFELIMKKINQKSESLRTNEDIDKGAGVLIVRSARISHES